MDVTVMAIKCHYSEISVKEIVLFPEAQGLVPLKHLNTLSKYQEFPTPTQSYIFPR